MEDSDLRIREVTSMAREANAAVYFVDTHGLQTHPGSGGAADPGTPNPSDFGRANFEAGVLESTGAQALADETGGLSFRNTNDLVAAGMRVARESRAYYLLGLRPRPGRKPGDWRKLEVTVTRPRLTVRTRKGYRLQRAVAAETTSAVVAAALDSAVDAGGIAVRATAFVFETNAKKLTRVLVAAEFDARQLRFEGASGSRAARLAVSVAVAQRDDGRLLTHGEQVEVRVSEGQDPGWRAVAREFELPAGVAQARVVVLDSRGGAIGTASHRFEVPPPGGLRLTTPLVTDRVHGDAGDGRPRAAIAVHRVFRPRGALYCDFEVLGAKTDPAARGPRVAAGMEVRAAGGAIVVKVDPTAIVPDARGRLARLIGLRSTAGLPAITSSSWTCGTRSRVRASSSGCRFRCVRINQDEPSEALWAEQPGRRIHRHILPAPAPPQFRWVRGPPRRRRSTMQAEKKTGGLRSEVIPPIVKRVVLLLALLGLILLAGFLIVGMLDNTRRREAVYYSILIKHYPATIGLPISALAALGLVFMLEYMKGPVEFEGLGFKFKGAAGPLVLWIACFLTINLSIAALWTREFHSSIADRVLNDLVAAQLVTDGCIREAKLQGQTGDEPEVKKLCAERLRAVLARDQRIP